MITTTDKYDGIIVDSTTLPQMTEDFEREMAELLQAVRHEKLIWVKLPIQKSAFIPILTNLDFEFHHCDEKNLMLVKKIRQDAVVPTTKNYIVGVAAVVLHNDLLLVVKDRFYSGYKLPGGHIEKQESIKTALKREVFEETGINIAFESIANLGHFKNGQFGESGLYIVCTAKACSVDINIQDEQEIIEAKWMPVQDFLQSEQVNPYNKSVVQAIRSNKELKLTEQHVPLRVADAEIFF